MADYHVMPVGDLNEQGKDHVALRTCWCEPVVRYVCHECAGEAYGVRRVCWLCEGTGWLPRGYANVLGAVVMHAAQDGRDES